MKIEIKPAYDDTLEIKKLFQEYTDMLVRNDSNFVSDGTHTVLNSN